MSTDLMSSIKRAVWHYCGEKGIDLSGWEFRSSDTECAICRMKRYEYAAQISDLLRDKLGAHTFILHPRTYAPHWCVIALVTILDPEPLAASEARHEG